jgi:hypothetical protein
MGRSSLKGPTFTKVPPKKRRPSTDKERAARLDREAAGEGLAIEIRSLICREP